MLQKGNYLKLETRYVKTVFRNGIYDKFCITMSVFWILDKIEENRYFSQVFHCFVEKAMSMLIQLIRVAFIKSH